MSKQIDFTTADNWFIGEDKLIEFPIFQADGVTPQNIGAWEVRWDVRKTASAADPALISKTTSGGGIVITGVYNADPVLNTQKIIITISDTDTDLLRPLVYHHSLKRMTTDGEAVLADGSLVLQQSAVR